MNLRKYLIELLKNNTGEDKNSKEIKQCNRMRFMKNYMRIIRYHIKKVRTCLKNLVEEEANLPNEEKQSVVKNAMEEKQIIIITKAVPIFQMLN